MATTQSTTTTTANNNNERPNEPESKITKEGQLQPDPATSEASAHVFPNPKLEPLAKYLESITRQLLEATNAHDRQLFHQLMQRSFSPRLHFAMSHPYQHILRSTCREDYEQCMWDYLDQLPAFRTESSNATTMIDEQNGKAQVFTTNRVSGHDASNEDFARESAIHYYFELDPEGKWWVTKLEIIRGPGHSLFADGNNDNDATCLI